MIDFSTLQGLTVPEGVVTKIESGGVVLWKLPVGGSIVLEVKKLTSPTYASSTTYNDEKFILLDIYPKSGGTVTVTYGDLTKTIVDDGTSENPNAQQVFFGTFNGVSDETETPDSGTLTIEGDCAAFGCGSYSLSSKDTSHYSGVISVREFGDVKTIPDYAFYHNYNLTTSKLPEGITSVGAYAFHMNKDATGILALTDMGKIVLPETLESIGDYAFCFQNGDHEYKMYSSVTFRGTTPPTLGTEPFGYGGNDIFVPVGCAEAYKTVWPDLVNIIKEVTE